MNLAPWQDLSTTFNALAIILQRGYKVELMILGDGRQRENFIAEVDRLGLADKVHFLGAKTPEAVNVYLNAADVGVAPFRRERNSRIGLSPLKIRDYAAAGLPVVSTDLPGLEMFHNETWIRLSDAENADDFAMEIIEQLDGPRADLALAAREYAEHNFSWKGVVQRIEAQVI